MACRLADLVLVNADAIRRWLIADGYPVKLNAAVRDLWAHKDLGSKTGSFSAEVPSHGVVMVTVKP